MDIEINIHCYNYQRRLTWMLSSILQQNGNMPNITISISYTPNNGDPTTEEVIKFFRDKGLSIVEIVLTPEQVSNRAIARTLRAKETHADWILYADGDLVYDPNFFADLKEKLDSEKYKDGDKVFGADRYSLNDKFCIEYFEKDDRKYPCEIENVVDIAKAWPVKWVSGKGTCAGYFQLARVSAIREKNVSYSNRPRDHWRQTKGDREFRINMGGRVPIEVLPIYHLNHDRGGPDIQR